MTAGLTLDHIQIDRAGRPLVRVDAHVAPGEVLTVMGPSGSGKSTLLAAIIGSLDPAFTCRGRIWLDGRDVTALPTRERRIGILFQDALLFPHLSVAGNLAFALPRGVSDRAGRIAAALAQAGLDGIGPRDPATLSGGERARVALLRTLLAEPKALLLDEPFSRLDADRRAQIRAFTFDIARANHLPVVLVSHDPDDANVSGMRTISPI
ncbi:ATP-binding cassette domain-containing protein [Rhodobacter sp. Har01]|uniref:ATP-binding cassette domain-containing protein n=1 Tax=Rhodobacter sp. Har01 TaxID=2883999 RepID=UPI001D091556|nr:ATP-binding cassette domain-containing protein [Rhodobacter sp. Har01]MCB6177514.1 ATP-binding cassette domain-containing protein [Rhodobacter sp. Har01]